MYRGVIIEESLSDKAVLKRVKIVDTEVEKVTERHRTPWLKQWTLHTVEIPEAEADEIAELLSKSLGDNYWYADFKNEATHYIVYPNKVFKVDRKHPEQYEAVTKHGLSLNIPEYQVAFAPQD